MASLSSAVEVLTREGGGREAMAKGEAEEELAAGEGELEAGAMRCSASEGGSDEGSSMAA